MRWSTTFFLELLINNLTQTTTGKLQNITERPRHQVMDAFKKARLRAAHAGDSKNAAAAKDKRKEQRAGAAVQRDFARLLNDLQRLHTFGMTIIEEAHGCATSRHPIH
jgi:hypothetical protein